MPYVAVDGIDTYYEVAGSGEPVLLLHGGFCSLVTQRPQIDSLSSAFEVHSPERPGHGRTRDREGQISCDQNVAETLGYMDAVGLERAHVVGFSDGANIGLLMAMHHPERVRSLVAISGNLDPAGVRVDEPEPDPGGPDVWSQMRAQYAELSPDGPDHADVVIGKLMRLWTEEPRIEPGELAAISAPSLIMAGDRDVIRTDHTVAIAAAIPGGQLCIVPGATHMLMTERPEIVNLVIHEFLARI